MKLVALPKLCFNTTVQYVGQGLLRRVEFPKWEYMSAMTWLGSLRKQYNPLRVCAVSVVKCSNFEKGGNGLHQG